MTTTSIAPDISLDEDVEARESRARTAELIAAIERVEPELLAEVEGNERNGGLSARSLELIVQTGLPLAIMPAELGGYGMFFSDGLPVVARLAEIDASIGWIGGNWSGLGAVMSYLPPATVDALMEGGPAYLGASGAPTGTARRVEGGYRLSGRWPFGSGSLHARYVFAMARILDEAGEPVLGPGGVPAMAMFGVPGDQIKSLGNWDVLGLRATGSVDYEIVDAFVPDGFVIANLFGPPLSGGRQTAGGFISVLPYLHTAFAIGTARRLVREVHTLATTPNSRGQKLADDKLFRHDYGQIVTRVDAARALVTQVWRDVDDKLKRGEPLVRRDHSTVRAACVNAHEVLRELAMFAFTRGSGTSLHDGTLQRLIRDALAGCQHAMAADAGYADVGWDYLGAPDNMVWGDRALVPLPS